MATETKQEIAVSQQPRTEMREAGKLPLLGPLEEMERLFDRLMPRNWMRPMVWNWPLWGGFEEALEGFRVPQLDVLDRDTEILIRLEMPGVDKKDLHISTNSSVLYIEGRTHREIREEKKDYVRCEIAQGNFARSFSIPAGVDPSKISATLKDGILEIVLPKEEGSQRRPIEVR